ncbi:hypothetical protein LQV63_23625 [Paenibacillus profundus]|uniref:Uncharacterized protein n=1 Tax=Paenibacillus profundus TaxID=1173085 RepID=A0ABS8YK68_9BACL|nr:hypothetical protein [Paenibacillus profundus]MCE5172273.1 hypothetical protein [Paenibacillus profundus]
MSIIGDVKQICDRLENGGWKDLFLKHGMDISSPDLRGELLRELPNIDRTIPGFEDFAFEGIRGIEPGIPARSLFYHALASSNVVDGLTIFPTLADLETVENLVFGIQPPSLNEIRLRGQNHSLALVVFAAEYRPASETVHEKHADMCFSRTGVARIGTLKAKYDDSIRGFLPFVDEEPHSIRVLPARYSLYIAAERKGEASTFGPMRFQPEDSEHTFWVPIHKLFDGTECIRDYDLNVDFKAHHVNEKLRRIHLELGKRYNTGWSAPEINEPPFIFHEDIADWSHEPAYGKGMLVPAVHAALVEEAKYKGNTLTFIVPQGHEKFSTSLEISPENGRWRQAPEYVHIRHRLEQDGTITNLNDKHDLAQIIDEGGYRAVHYIDYTADGCIEAACPELAFEFPRSEAAYSLVTAPDFFPSCEQGELTKWWIQSVPNELQDELWETPPYPLSDQRIAANLEFKTPDRQGGRTIFSKDDKTMTAIVSLFYNSPVQRSTHLSDSKTTRHSYLPDAASGIFAPGWDVSRDRANDGTEFLSSYGLGSPFPEDSKLCAALSTFWPAVSPDAARTFEPFWPTVSPLTDEEIGQKGNLPWDGVPGPKQIPESKLVDYHSLAYSDYVDHALDNKFTMALTGRIDASEYKARVLSMAYAYRALDITNTEKRLWSVLSFQKVASNDEELQTAIEQSRHHLGGTIYRFVIYRRGSDNIAHPDDFRKIRIEMQEEATLFVNGIDVLLKRNNGNWTHVRPHE